jgi:uncharacterized membrane protein
VCYLFFKNTLTNEALKYMNLKRTFGTILTVLGIVGLIYTGFGIINHDSRTTSLFVIGIIALLFFFTGISLIRNTKDEA